MSFPYHIVKILFKIEGIIDPVVPDCVCKRTADGARHVVPGFEGPHPALPRTRPWPETLGQGTSSPSCLPRPVRRRPRPRLRKTHNLFTCFTTCCYSTWVFHCSLIYNILHFRCYTYFYAVYTDNHCRYSSAICVKHKQWNCFLLISSLN